MKWYVLLKAWGNQAIGAKLQMSEDDAKSLVDTGFAKECTEDPTAEVVDSIVKKLMPQFTDLITKSQDIMVKGIEGAVTKAKDKLHIEISDPRKLENNFGYKSTDLWLGDIKLASAKNWDPSKASDNFKSYAEATYKSATGLNTAFGEDGGFLIMPQISTAIFARVYERGQLLGKIDQYTVGAGSNGMKFNRDSESSRATGSRRGGIRGYWTQEAGQITSSRPKFDQMELSLKKLCVMAYMTDEMNSDNFMGLEQYLVNCAADEIDFLLHDAIINGNGTGLPLGVLNSPGRVTQAAVSGQGAGTVVGTNISKMWSRLHPSCRGNAIWLANQEVEPQLDSLTLAIGTGGSTWPLYLPPGGLADLPYGRLKGRPVIVCEWCPAVGTEGDLILWDPSSYCSITKGGVKSAMSIHLRFDYDELVWRFTFRFDGQPWWNKPLTPFKGTSTLSSMVTLSSTRT